MLTDHQCIGHVRAAFPARAGIVFRTASVCGGLDHDRSAVRLRRVQDVRLRHREAIAPGNICELNALRAVFRQSDGTVSALFNEILLADFARARAGGMR